MLSAASSISSKHVSRIGTGNATPGKPAKPAGFASMNAEHRAKHVREACIGPEHKGARNEGRGEKRKVGLQVLAHDFPSSLMGSR
jgi:hypothetical protein